MKYSTMFILSLLLTSGCGSDPVADYKEFVVAEMKQINETNDKFTFAIDTAKINVEKTDSLVSPLLGTCVTKGLQVFNITNEDGEKLESIRTFEVTLTHGYQENKWIMTSGEAQFIEIEILKDTSKPPGFSYTIAQMKDRWASSSVTFENMDELSNFIKNP